MKTSEFIRTAVDQYLSPVKTVDFINRKAPAPYLCICLEKLKAEYAGTTFWPESHHISQVFQDTICEDIGNCTVGTALLDAGYYCTHEEIQQIRFMYAEFIALEFEDAGD